MNYDFPEIKTIQDVLPHISGRDEFRVMDKDWYTVINYMVSLENTFLWDENDPIGSAVRRECRGLTFDKEGKLICRKYHKFFNVGEKEETQLNKINLYEPHIVLEKIDGSLISVQPSPYGFRLVSKAGVTDVAMNAEVFIADKPHYDTFIRKCFQRNITPLFEWVSRKNRIVVDYPEDNLILTGMRDKTTGCYVYYDAMLKYATAWNIPVVKAVDGLAVQNINLFVKQVREWDDGEGVVIRFDNGHMVKVKADEYILRHRSKEQINSEKNIIQVILNDAVDDMIPLLTEDDATRLRKFQSEFWSAVDEVAQDLTSIFEGGDKMYPDKKEFAVEFVNRMILPMHRPFMFGMKQGKECKQLLIDSIEKSLSSQTKLNDSRWMFGGISWN